MLRTKKLLGNHWKHESDFNTHEEYVNYIQSLPFSSQLKIAEANIPVAQRVLAAYYHDLKKFDESAIWWKKAAKNEDPLALLHETEESLIAEKIDQAKSFHASALNVIKKTNDIKFKKFVLEVANNISNKFVFSFFNLGLKKYEENKLEEAKELWKQAADLGSPAAAYNIAKLVKDENPKEAIYYSNLTLFLSQGPNADNSNELRAAAHNLLGTLLADSLSKEANYKELEEIVAHFKKAEAYEKDRGANENLNKFIRIIPDEEIKKTLLKETEVILFNNGIYKTISEMLSHPFISPTKTNNWLTYPDPRDEQKLSNEENEKNIKYLNKLTHSVYDSPLTQFSTNQSEQAKESEINQVIGFKKC